MIIVGVSNELEGVCAICGGPPPEELTGLVCKPGPWAHKYPCFDEDPERFLDASGCSCNAAKTLEWLGGTLVSKHDGISMNQTWIKMDEIQPDGSIRVIIKKCIRENGLLVEIEEYQSRLRESVRQQLSLAPDPD